MANYSDLTRKEQVLAALKERAGEWINGADLANERVGGSEGLKRLRELKNDGWLIQMRRSPVKGSDQFQYRLAVQLTADGRLAYHDPAQMHKEPEVERRTSPSPPARSDPPAQRPAGSTQSAWWDPNATGENPDTAWSDWKPAKKLRGALEHVFWLERKQRVIGAIGPDFDGTRWFWGILVPANRARGTSERRVAHGVVESKSAARAAVEEKIRHLREVGLPR